MWCLSCFKPPNTVDAFDAETDIALEVSRHEAELQEAEQISLAIQESSRLLHQQKEEEEEKRRRRRDIAVQNDEQIARAYQYDEEREMQMGNNNNTYALEEEEQLALALQESSRLLRQQIAKNNFEEQVKKDEQMAKDLKRKEFEEQVKKDKQIAKDLKRKQFEEQAKKDEQIAKVLKRKQFEEQAKKDEQIAKDLRNHYSKMETEERTRLHSETIEKSLIEKRKKKQFEDEQVENDEQIAKELQNVFSEIDYEESSGLADKSSVSSETAEKYLNEKGKGKQFEDNNNIFTRVSLDEDEQLDEVIWESLKGKGKGKQSKDEMEEDEKLPEVIPPHSICCGCDSEIEHGKSVDILGVLWHPECLWCDACQKPIAENHVSNARGKYHQSCYERYCYICKEKKMRRYNEHPFWKERYCPTHESDGTHKCCSCERLEPRGTDYVMLGDTRWLCLQCMESAVMDSHECQHLHFEIRDFFEGLNMKIEKEFPFLLVEKHALNKAEKKEKIDNQYEVVTRGICLSEAQTVTSVSKARRTGPRKQQIEKVTEAQTVFGDCNVTAILILYGLPRLLTGYILAHEMTHAYLRLNGHRKLNNVHEEGICQVLGHMWLESQTYASSDAAIAAEASSSRTPPQVAATASKKGNWSGFEKKLVEFCKHQIETDESPVYGDGFRKVNEMVTNSTLQETLKEIIRLG